MSFLANLNSFYVANEVAVVTVVAAALVLFQLALLAGAFMGETAVSTFTARKNALTIKKLKIKN